MLVGNNEWLKFMLVLPILKKNCPGIAVAQWEHKHYLKNSVYVTSSKALVCPKGGCITYLVRILPNHEIK